MGTRWVAVAVLRVTPGDWRPGDTREHTPGDTREHGHVWDEPRWDRPGGTAEIYSVGSAGVGAAMPPHAAIWHGSCCRGSSR